MITRLVIVVVYLCCSDTKEHDVEACQAADTLHTVLCWSSGVIVLSVLTIPSDLKGKTLKDKENLIKTWKTKNVRDYLSVRRPYTGSS